MPHAFTITRGLPTAVLVFFLGACSAPAPQQPPAPRSLVSVAEALRVGDLQRLRAEQAKGAGLATHAAPLAAQLDPPAWLIAMGAGGREHDLPAAAQAMAGGDDAALAAALGFSDQQLMADILGGGGSIYTRRADGRNYFETGPQPIQLLDDFSAPALVEGAIAIELTLWGTLEERNFKLSYALDVGGVTSLQAVLDLAGDAPTAAPRTPRYLNPQLALPSTGLLHGIDARGLADPHWTAAAFAMVRDDATIERARMARDSEGWALVESSSESQGDRLAKLRDDRLEFLRLRATDYLRTSGRWPRGLHEISYKPWQLNDPASPDGRLGWADHDPKPPAGFALAESAEAEYAVIAAQATGQGRRAVTRDGRFIWVR